MHKIRFMVGVIGIVSPFLGLAHNDYYASLLTKALFGEISLES